MIAVIDCGTTHTRLYIIDDSGSTVAQGKKKIGVRDTSITGSRDALRNGLRDLFEEVLASAGIAKNRVDFAVSSGMITSEIGLMEIPHLVAPVSGKDLADNIVEVNDPAVVPLGVPILFIRGIRNNYGDNVRLSSIRRVDFMRGEEVQCMGIADWGLLPPPLNLVVLSSHTKIIHIDADKRVRGCITTLSGQIYEALLKATSIGKSLIDNDSQEPGGYNDDEIMNIAAESVENAGIVRTLLMPRFMEVLLKTGSHERQVFANAAIAADDMKAFDEFASLGFGCENYILFGHESRCEMYTAMLRRKFPNAKVASVSDENDLNAITTAGTLSVLRAAGRTAIPAS